VLKYLTLGTKIFNLVSMAGYRGPKQRDHTFRIYRHCGGVDTESGLFKNKNKIGSDQYRVGDREGVLSFLDWERPCV
jgi:hypothetical protein